MTYYDNKLDSQVSDTFLLSRGPQTRALHKVGYDVIEIADDEGESKPNDQEQTNIGELDQNSIVSFDVNDIINSDKAIDVKMEDSAFLDDDEDGYDGPPTILLSSSLTNFEDNDTVCSDITSEDVFDDESVYEKSYDGIVSIDEDEVDYACSNPNIPKYLDVCFVPLHQQKESSLDDMPCNGDEISFEGRQFYFVDCDTDANDMELDGMELSVFDETQRPSDHFQVKTNPDIIVIDDDDDV